MTIEQYEKLKPLEAKLQKALDNKQVILTSADVRICQDILGYKLPCNCGGGKRRRAELVKLANMYFSFK